MSSASTFQPRFQEGVKVPGRGTEGFHLVTTETWNPFGNDIWYSRQGWVPLTKVYAVNRYA